MKKIIVLLVFLAISAAAAPVFPPMTGGDFVFTVQPGDLFDIDGVPLTPPTASIGIVPETGGVPIGCVATNDPFVSYQITAKVTATGQRKAFKGQAFLTADCTVTGSDLSDNTAYTYPGMNPNKPKLQ